MDCFRVMEREILFVTLMTKWFINDDFKLKMTRVRQDLDLVKKLFREFVKLLLFLS